MYVLAGCYLYHGGRACPHVRCSFHDAFTYLNSCSESVTEKNIFTIMFSIGIMITPSENRRTRSKPCHISTLSNTNPTWTGLGSNPSIRDERPTTNGMSHETTYGLRYTRIDIELLRDFLWSHFILTDVRTAKLNKEATKGSRYIFSFGITAEPHKHQITSRHRLRTA